MMPALGFTGPINTLVITSILMNFALTTILQIYAARDIQRSTSEASGRAK
jgi:hypothetical protein